MHSHVSPNSLWMKMLFICSMTANKPSLCCMAGMCMDLKRGVLYWWLNTLMMFNKQLTCRDFILWALKYLNAYGAVFLYYDSLHYGYNDAMTIPFFCTFLLNFLCLNTYLSFVINPLLYSKMEQLSGYLISLGIIKYSDSNVSLYSYMHPIKIWLPILRPTEADYSLVQIKTPCDSSQV